MLALEQLLLVVECVPHNVITNHLRAQIIGRNATIWIFGVPNSFSLKQKDVFSGIPENHAFSLCFLTWSRIWSSQWDGRHWYLEVCSWSACIKHELYYGTQNNYHKILESIEPFWKEFPSLKQILMLAVCSFLIFVLRTQTYCHLRPNCSASSRPKAMKLSQPSGKDVTFKCL